MSTTRALAGTALMITVGSCATVPRPSPLPTPKPPVAAPAAAAVTLPAPAVSGAWDEIPEIAGDWRYDSARRAVRFVDASGLERASLTCTAPGTAPGTAPRSAMQLMLFGNGAVAATVMTSAGTNQLTLTGGAVNIAVDDPVLDRIAFSRGRFGVRATSLLVLPVQSEIGRVIEDCRG